MRVLNLVDEWVLQPLFRQKVVFCDLEEAIQYITGAVCHALGCGDAVLAVGETQDLNEGIGGHGLPDLEGG